MEGRYAYSCWEDDSIVPNRLRDEGTNCFAVELRFRHEVEKANDYGGGDALLLYSYRKLFFLPPPPGCYEDDDMEFLLYHNIPRTMLPEIVKYSIIDEAITTTRRMLNDVGEDSSNKEKKKKKIFALVVDVVVRTRQSPFENEKEAIARAVIEYVDATRDDVAICPVWGRKELMEAIINKVDPLKETASFKAVSAATKASIQSLEYIKLDNSLCAAVKNCHLCHEGLLVGMVVTRVPCSHIYHAACVARLLMRRGVLCGQCCPPRPLPAPWGISETGTYNSDAEIRDF